MLQLNGGGSGKSVRKTAFPVELEYVLLLWPRSSIRLFREEVHQRQQQLTRLLRQSLDSRENEF